MMRPWAGPIGFLGAAASLAFWIIVPFVATGNNAYVHNEGFYVAFAVMSAVGVAGALLTAGSTRLAPGLLAIAIVPAVAALLVPGAFVIVATLLALEVPEAGVRRTIR